MAATVEGFKSQFDRGQFDFGTSTDQIRDKDINQAFSETDAIFNPNIYPDESASDLAYYYLAAHFVQLDLEAIESEGQPVLLQNSRSADGISESLNIPKEMMNGDFAQYATTWYGQKWFMLTLPYLGGSVHSVGGATRP